MQELMLKSFLFAENLGTILPRLFWLGQQRSRQGSSLQQRTDFASWVVLRLLVYLATSAHPCKTSYHQFLFITVTFLDFLSLKPNNCSVEQEMSSCRAQFAGMDKLVRLIIQSVEASGSKIYLQEFNIKSATLFLLGNSMARTLNFYIRRSKIRQLIMTGSA